MNLVEFAEFLITKITKEPDMVKVKEFDMENEKVLEVLVSEADMGRVIGKGGRMSKSIKTIIQAKAYNDGIKKVKINISSF